MLFDLIKILDYPKKADRKAGIKNKIKSISHQLRLIPMCNLLISHQGYVSMDVKCSIKFEKIRISHQVEHK